MSLQVEKLEHNMAKLTIEVSAEEVEKALQAAYLKERSKISLPGFRKGKVPRQMIEKMYGPEVFYDEAANRMISEAYAKAYVDRWHFSKIRKDVNYVPNKKTVLAFTIALELSLDEAKDLLASAGFALSRSSKTDIIVAYFLQNKIYDMFEINDVLDAYGQPVF